MTRRFLACSLALAAMLVVSACGFQLEKMFPEKVAGGVARLSMRNASIASSLIADDTACGFASEAVLSSGEQAGEIGSVGTLTHTVEGCELDLGELHVVKTDCLGIEYTAGGRIVVDAKRSVRGILTGNPASPIIPEGPDAVTLEIAYEPSEYQVRVSNRITALTQTGGKVSFKAQPHLAVSDAKGICAVPTADLTISELSYDDVDVVVDSGEGQPFPVEVPTSSLTAQLGKYGALENHLEGEITIWDSTHSVPVPEDEDQVLDPDYDAQEWVDSYTCKDDLRVPVSFECESLLPKLAGGVAALTISTFGNLAKLADAKCFSRPGVLATPTLTGEVGEAGGSARWDVDDCLIEMPSKTSISEDCLGKEYFAEGKVRVSGSKVVSGLLTGDALQPVIPLSTSPAVVSLSISFEGFAITDNKSENRLWLREGTLEGTSRPKTAVDTVLGVCSVPTPVASFEGVRLAGAVVDLAAQGNTFTLRVDDAALEAQNGKNGARENYLAGEITIEGERFSIPVEGEPVLDPMYSPSSFYTAYACTPNMEVPASDADCSLAQMLGENAARLLVLTTGTVASMVNTDDGCGFENTMLLMSPDEVVGESGAMGSISWSVEGCDLSRGLSTYSEDCLGGATWVDGDVVVDAARTVYGEREKKFFIIDSIIPRERAAVDVRLSNVQLSEFVAYQVAAGDDEPKGKLTIHSGNIVAEVHPRLGERESDPGRFDVATPLAELTSISLAAAQTTLESQGKTFKLHLTDVQLYARNGVFEGFGNQVSGSMRVNGELIELGPIPLNPDFEQSTFDDSYVCLEDLLEVIPTSE